MAFGTDLPLPPTMPSSDESILRVGPQEEELGRECPPVAHVPDVTVVNGERRWHVGTLTYTTSGLAILFFWLLWGDFAYAFKDRSLGPVVQLLLKQFHSTDTTASILLASLPQALTVVLAPIISVKSDRYRSRWGRRIPFLLLPTPIIVLSMFGLAFAPAIAVRMFGGAPASDHSVLLIIAIFWTTFELSATVVNAVFSAFVNDVVPRPFLGRFYGLFRSLSLIAGIIFNYTLFGKASEHYTGIFIGSGLLYGIGFTMMCLGVKEGEYPPPPPLPAPGEPGSGNVVQRFKSGAITYLRESFSNPYYIAVFLAIAIPNIAFLPINTFNLYFSLSVGLDNDHYGKYLAYTYVISLFQAYPVGWLVDRYHSLRVCMVAVALHAVAALWGGLFVHGPTTFAVAFIATGVLSGTFFTASASLGLMLLPRARFAQFASANAIVQSFGMMLAAPLAGIVLDHTGHKYRLTYTGGFILDVLGIAVMWIVYVQFKKLGGTKGYVAPE
ncbi:MAG: MFS transporter [Tepidisphaeraceae bacterium]